MTDEARSELRENLNTVYDALKFKGYNPISQLVGFLLSGDPSYSTTYNNARKILTDTDREDILEELLLEYFRDK